MNIIEIRVKSIQKRDELVTNFNKKRRTSTELDANWSEIDETKPPKNGMNW